MTTASDVHASASDENTSTDRAIPRLADRARLFATAVEAPSRVVLAVSALLTLVSWHLPAFDPTQPKGDNDFGLFVALAHQTGLSFGDRIATTYGPLYFLSIPSVVNRFEVALAYLVWFGFVTACLAAMYQALRRHLSPRGSWVVTAAVALSFSITPLSAVITATFGFAVILAIFYARAELPRWADRAFPIAMGVLVAAMLLSKFSVGLMIGPVVLGAVLARSGRVLRALLEYAIAGVAALIVLWIAAAQPPLQLVEYVGRAVAVGGSYADAVGYERVDGRWEYVVAAGLAVLVGVGALRMRFAGRRWLLWIGVAAGMFLMFKQGFIRHDSHSAQFFASAFGLAAVLAAVRRSAALVCAAVIALLTQTVSQGGGFWTIDPARGVQQFADGALVVVSGGHRDLLLANARAQAIHNVPVPQSWLDRIGRSSVRAEPFSMNFEWSRGLTFSVFPTILNYGGWNERLDELDAEWTAADATAPQFLLRENGRFTLDNRFPLWDPPRTQVEQACRYRLVESNDAWRLLERIPNRCGAEQPVGEVTAAAGAPVSVPAVGRGDILIARVYPERSIGQRAKAVLFRSGELWLTIDDEAHRLPFTHAGAPLMVSAPGDESLTQRGRELNTSTLTMNAPGRIAFSVMHTS